MALPDTNTLDIPSRGSSALTIYSLVGSQSADTGTLDYSSRGASALTIFSARVERTFAAVTTLEKYPQKVTFAGNSILSKPYRGTFGVNTKFEGFAHRNTAAWTILEKSPVLSRFALLTTFELTNFFLSNILKDGSTDFFSNSGGSISGAVTTLLKRNQIMIVRYASKANQGDASGITYNGIAMTRLTNETTPDGDCVSIWGLLNPSVGTFNVVVTAPVTGSLTAIAVDRYYNVRQSLSAIVTAIISSSTSQPPTKTLDLVNRGLPNRYVYDTIGAQTINTASLDISSRGGPATTIYNVPIGSKTASLSITPNAANGVVLDVLNNMDGSGTLVPAETESFNTANVGGSSFAQSGGPTAKSMSWTLPKGGRWIQAAIALERALNGQNTFSTLTTLSLEGQASIAAVKTFLEANRPATVPLLTTLEKYLIYDLGPGLPMGLLIALMFGGGNGVSISTLFEVEGNPTFAVLTLLNYASLVGKETSLVFKNKRTILKFKKNTVLQF